MQLNTEGQFLVFLGNAIWAHRDPNNDAQFTIFQNGPMGPSLSKIPKIALLGVFMTWKICLLRQN